MRLTGPRVYALRVLHAVGGSARYSNTTSLEDRTVYWQTANWLAEEGLAKVSGSRCTLTPKGADVACSLSEQLKLL